MITALAASGCQRPPEPIELTSQPLQFASPDEYDVFFDHCVDTLRRYGFRLDRVDRRAGVITTFPETSAQFFEFWRRDVATRYDRLESSLTTIRRKAEIAIEREPSPDEGRLVVNVIRERLSTPDRQYNNSGAAFLVYSQNLPATTGRPIVPSRDEYWISDGRDAALETRLIAEISGAS